MGPKPDISGVYQIRNKVNGLVYIGSSCHIYHRWREHKKALQSGRHHSYYLQAAWDEYGEDAFAFEILEVTLSDPIILQVMEQKWLDTLKSYRRKKGYNLNKTANASVKSEETLNRIRSNVMKGESHIWHKLTVDQVCKIKRRLALGERNPVIAADFGVSVQTISGIKQNRKWKCVPWPHGAKPVNHARGDTAVGAKLTETRVVEIKRLVADGCEVRSIAELYGVSDGAIQSIIRNESWVDVPWPVDYVAKSRREKLSDEDVVKIRQYLEQGRPQKDIAREYKVSASQICRISNGVQRKGATIKG